MSKPRALKAAGLCALVAVGMVAAAGGRVGAQSASVQINVDAAANRHAINPNVYGVAYATQAQLAELNVPLNRRGGNPTSRYNWQLNADNRGSDWFFESLPYDGAAAGDDADQFVSGTKAAGAQAMITIPTLGWMAKLGSGRTALGSFSVKKYGAQQDADGDNGNGVRGNGANITGNDPNDASAPSNSDYQQGWVNHLTGKFGTAAAGGVRYYIMDNEPSLWNGTHRDVHPVGSKLDEIRDKMIDYGAKVKQADPGALIVGPEEWGWPGYLYSGFDQDTANNGNWSTFPDKAAHGNMDYMPYILDQLHKYEIANGKRLLDVFTVHYYPQAATSPWRNPFSDDTDSATQLYRNECTRSLWDPAYVDKSWINDTVMLIPRLRNWANTYYPGTQIGVTEYNFGAEGHINGATTLADVWGIFGREGLDMANYWTIPNTGTPTYNAMKLYRNYDGAKGAFGDTGVSAAVPNPDNVSAFAALRSSDGALTVMAINKTTSITNVNVNLSNYAVTGGAQAYQLTSANQITRLTDVPVRSGALSARLPAQSITLFVLGGSVSTSPQASVANLAFNPSTVTSGGSSQGTVNLTAAAPAGGATVTLSSSSPSATVPATVTVPAGATSATFTANTGTVSTSTDATVTAAVNGSSAPSTLTIQPAVAAVTFSDATHAAPAKMLLKRKPKINGNVTCKVTCKTGSLSQGVLDVEIYNSAGTKVAQATFPKSTLAARHSRTLHLKWTATARDTYTVKVGVFTQDFGALLYWNDAAATVHVN